ncbi:hypothetical protein Aph01nite_05250 [Acrocarpospora phusangensis]|uniref:Polyketide cyclase n=1 Tax=Acrocarpospora phusangensis TaxID=1070424 RepID=A0A919Q7Q9_9ACTN|nr:SRPBCC family protein [Acrocarpospora phusangensis]GIH22215.1 hypothetical protein Aph01nite_05250 [Acrocarpospora phusangensis]
MRFESTVFIDASPQRVWEVFSDVESWPEWTGTVDSVELLDPGPLRVGSRARIKQPKLPIADWRVTELVEGRSFTWVSTGPGLRVTGGHHVEPAGTGTLARATIDQQGLLGSLTGRVLANLINRYLRMEGEGLKARSERN